MFRLGDLESGTRRFALTLVWVLALNALDGRCGAQQVVIQPGPDEGKDIWTTSVYSNVPGAPAYSGPGCGIDNGYLVVGGWGDSYYSLLQFGLGGLPARASSAVLSLSSFPDTWHVGATTVEMYLDRVTTPWSMSAVPGQPSSVRVMWWSDLPSTTSVRTTPLPAPSTTGLYNIDITDLYNGWQAGTYPNYGLQLRPTNNSDKFNNFRSSDYTADPSLRPKITIIPAIPLGQLPTGAAPVRNTAIKLPSPDSATGGANFAFPIRTTSPVFLNTEAGGVSCSDAPVDGVDYGYYDPYHASGGFYSLDFDITKGTADVVAAKAGKIVRVDGSAANYGPVVTIYHGGGFFSEYREFTLDPTLTVGATIPQGFRLGVLHGSTGEMLHFQIKHNATDDPNSFGQGLSSLSDQVLHGLTAGGVAFTATPPIAQSFVLNRDPSQPVTINGQTGQPRPLQTAIAGVLPPSGPTQTVPVGEFSSLPGFTTSDTGTVDIAGGSLALHTGSPVWAAAVVPVSETTGSVTCDIEFTSPSGAEGLLSVYWNGEFIGTVDERYADPGAATYTFDLGSEFAPNYYTLAFRLDPFTTTQSVAVINNISFSVVPDPSGLTMLGCMAVLFLRRRAVVEHTSAVRVHHTLLARDE